MDDVSLVRRQELLSRARRQRYEWLEACRGLDSGRRSDDEAALPRELRRECEFEVLEELCRPVFPCGAEVIRFLSGTEGASEALLPGFALAETMLTERVEDKLVASEGYSEDDGTDAMIERLKRPDVVDVVRSMQHFVGEYVAAVARSEEDEYANAYAVGVDDNEEFLCEDNEGYYSEARRRIEAFASRTAATLHGQHSPWSEDPGGVARTATVVETMLHRKLNVVLFGAGSPDTYASRRASIRDARFRARLDSLSFVDWSHLEVAPIKGSNASWNAALLALQTIDAEKAPADKTRALRFAVQCVSDALRQQQTSSKEPDADSLLPAMVVAIVRSRPNRLESNLRYLKRFGKSHGRDGYLVTQVVGACDFLARADHSSFAMSKLDFEAALKENARVSAAAAAVLQGSSKPETQPGEAEDADAKVRQEKQNGNLPATRRNDDDIAKLNGARKATATTTTRQQVSAREIRALRLARRAESRVIQASRLTATHLGGAGVVRHSSNENGSLRLSEKTVTN